MAAAGIDPHIIDVRRYLAYVESLADLNLITYPWGADRPVDERHSKRSKPVS